MHAWVYMYICIRSYVLGDVIFTPRTDSTYVFEDQFLDMLTTMYNYRPQKSNIYIYIYTWHLCRIQFVANNTYLLRLDRVCLTYPVRLIFEAVRRVINPKDQWHILHFNSTHLFFWVVRGYFGRCLGVFCNYFCGVLEGVRSKHVLIILCYFFLW